MNPRPHTIHSPIAMLAVLSSAFTDLFTEKKMLIGIHNCVYNKGNYV